MARPMALAFIVALCQFSLVLGLKLKKENPCRCRFENGSVIDLDTDSADTGPSFKNEKANATGDNATYFYNPCKPFSLGACKDVALCQNSSGQFFSLGQHSSAEFILDENTNSVVITYINHNTLPVRQTNVTLRCSPQKTFPKLFVIGETIPSSGHYQMVLFSACACPDGCVERAPADEGLSTGTILIILVLVFFLTYLLGGIVFMRLVQGATGWEMIPNHDFWFGLPALVKDGVVFALGGCKGEETYDRI